MREPEARAVAILLNPPQNPPLQKGGAGGFLEMVNSQDEIVISDFIQNRR
jgi:hypothetical protein